MPLNKGKVSGKTKLNKADKRLMGRKGFTLSETLITVAIVIILFAIAIPSIVIIQRHLRQKELDAKAETIYMAVQDQLSNLNSSGSPYNDGVELKSNQVPEDMGLSYDEEGKPINRQIKYIYNGYVYTDDGSSVTREALDYVLPQTIIDATLRSKNWVIEYEPNYCTVYAVYYSEELDIQNRYQDNWSFYNTLRDKKERIKNGAKVGYYGGDAVAAGGGDTFMPDIIVYNGEKLTVRLTSTAPGNIKVAKFRLTMTDEDGHQVIKEFDVNRSLQLFYYDLVLDSLESPDTRFKALYGTEGLSAGYIKKEPLVPGQKLTLTLDVEGYNTEYQPASFTRTTNSLFADESNDAEKETQNKAIIKFGRHLQNLDESSGVTLDTNPDTKIKEAEQQNDIIFSDDVKKTSDWFDTYSRAYFNGNAVRNTANFKPIENDIIEKYDGKGYTISYLNISSSGDAGLFKELKGNIEIKDLFFSGAYVHSTGGNAGALAGSVSGDNTKVDSVGSFLKNSDYSDIDAAYKYAWIQGKENAGGLIGKMSGDKLEIKKSFASTVINSNANDNNGHSGGLVGYLTQGNLTMDESYADSYIYGGNTGGLACTDDNTNVTAVRDCYVAGFQSGKKTEAGLVNGGINEAKRCYTIAAKMDDSKSNGYYSTARTIRTKDSIYFLNSGSTSNYDVKDTDQIKSMSQADLRDALNDGSHNKFTTNTGSAIVYNLKKLGLNGYGSYPGLTANRHYGDWKASFQNGS